MRRLLRKYQIKAANKFRNRNYAFFAMEMRLGKTLTCIRWLKKKGASKWLIAAPKTVLISWEDELSKEGLDFINLTDGTLVDRVIDLFQLESPIALINYETISKLERAIRAIGFDAIICDESVKIKNPKAGTTKSLILLGKEVKYRAALSGLPTPNSWEDIFTQMQFVCGGSWMGFSNFYAWRSRLFSKQGYQHFLSKQTRNKIKSAFDADAFALSRHEAGYNNEPVIQNRYGEMPTKTRKIYSHIQEYWEYPDESKSTKVVLTAIQWLQRICGGTLPDSGGVDTWKITELKAIVNEELPKDCSIVIWCAFNDEIERLAKELGDCLVRTGKNQNNPQTQRYFQAGKKRIIIVQAALGKYGIRLDRADTAIYYSATYDYDTYAQSKDRILDVRKKYPLLIINLITKDSVEKDIHELLRKKKKNAKELLIQKIQAAGPVLVNDRPRNTRVRPGPLGRRNPKEEPDDKQPAKRLVIKVNRDNL